MPHTYSQINVHLVFSTKERRRLIMDLLRGRLYPYLTALVNNDFGFARAIGGTRDHVHILADVRTGVCVSDLVRSVKSISSGWIRRNVPRQGGFAWQEGYGAFSVSASSIPAVREYVESQEVRHRARSFEDEFKALLHKHGVRFEERYL
jgi:REP element-mobilizing transposase RayT